MKEIFNFKITSILVILYIFISAGIIIYFITSPSNLQGGQLIKKYVVTDEQSIVNNCEGLPLFLSVACLRDNIYPFYNYTRRLDIPQPFEDLKAKGGDCYDYAYLYESLAGKLGFNKYVFSIQVGNINHGFTVISGEEGYCILDQQAYKCFELQT